MIRRDDHGDFLLITQHDHALLAGELAEVFGNERFAAPQPLESAIKGISLHDCGWPLHDDEPTLNKEGKPIDVFESTAAIALKVWTASADRTAAQDPYAGLLVSLHVLSLSVFATTQTPFEHEKFSIDDPQAKFGITRFQHHEIERQEQLRMKLGLRTDRPTHHKQQQEVTQKKEDQLTFNFRLLQAMDAISLAACCTQPPSSETQDVHERPGGARLRLALSRRGNDVVVVPWPFSVPSVELKIPATRIPGRAYMDVDDLRTAYAIGEAEILTSIVMPKAATG